MLLSILMWLLVALVGVVVSTVFAIYLFLPKYMVKIMQRISLLQCGLKLRKLRLGEETIEYIERAQPSPSRPSIIFLHGFSSNKETWTQTIKYLPRDVHVVAFDLPSHGGTSYNLPEHDLSIHAFAEHLHRYIRALGLNRRPFHLVGQSMGGAVCGTYSATYPQDVALATLICPGMKAPEPTDIVDQVQFADDDPLIPDSCEGLQQAIDMCHYNNVVHDVRLLKGMVEIQKPRKQHYEMLIRSLRSDRELQDLIDALPRISVPVQVIWGKYDKVVDIGALSILQEHLPRLRRVDIIPDCGHSVNVDQPPSLARLLLIYNNSLTLTN